jgi:hypothetical protein
MADMGKANRKLRRASGLLGCLASVQLAFFWAVGLAVVGFCAWGLLFGR